MIRDLVVMFFAVCAAAAYNTAKMLMFLCALYAGWLMYSYVLCAVLPTQTGVKHT